jgi:DtxR family Mn-dependent transcriptional regulator
MEDYVEAIYLIVQDKQAARAKDISDRLGVNRSSVSGALRTLSEKNLINHVPYDIITLTEDGKKVAEGIIRRHTVLRTFFTEVLGVDFENAEKSACGMEHTVSDVILDRLTQFIDFIKDCPRMNIRWKEQEGGFCNKTVSRENCRPCIEECLQSLEEDHTCKNI